MSSPSKDRDVRCQKPSSFPGLRCVLEADHEDHCEPCFSPTVDCWAAVRRQYDRRVSALETQLAGLRQKVEEEDGWASK